MDGGRGRAQVQQPALGGGRGRAQVQQPAVRCDKLKGTFGQDDEVLSRLRTRVLSRLRTAVLSRLRTGVLSRVTRELSSTNCTIHDGTVQALVCVCGFALCCPRTERLYLNRGCTVA